jgi:hypothetical protein
VREVNLFDLHSEIIEIEIKKRTQPDNEMRWVPTIYYGRLEQILVANFQPTKSSVHFLAKLGYWQFFLLVPPLAKTSPKYLPLQACSPGCRSTHRSPELYGWAVFPEVKIPR